MIQDSRYANIPKHSLANKEEESKHEFEMSKLEQERDKRRL